MKYVAIIDSDEFSEDDVHKLMKRLHFVGYHFKIISVKKVPEKISNYVVGYFQDGYNQALSDCGVIEDDSN